MFVITGTEHFFVVSKEPEGKREAGALYRQFDAFGPLPSALVRHVDKTEAGEMLREIEKVVVEKGRNNHITTVTEDILNNFNNEAKSLLIRMLNLDPAKRPTMSDVLADPYWDGVESPPMSAKSQFPTESS